jgi:hypothetical protein
MRLFHAFASITFIAFLSSCSQTKSPLASSYLDRLLSSQETMDKIIEASRDLSDDEWLAGSVTRPGKRNVSRTAREAQIANAILQKIGPDLRRMSSEDLLSSLKTYDLSLKNSFSGVSYYIYRDGNELIMKELERRGKQAGVVLKTFSESKKEIFTGDAGRSITVGEFVRSLSGK